MFDIGFMELALVGVVALLVIGPERLPLVARKLGIWVGKARRFISSVQSDFKEEVDKAEQLRRLMEEQAKIQSYHEILEQSGEDEKGRVPVDRLPHKSKSFSDATDTTDNAAPTAAGKTQSVAVADNASAAIKNSEDHDKAK